MPETKRYAVNPKSIEAYRIRLLLHCEELHRETNPAIRATLALYLAKATTLAQQLQIQILTIGADLLEDERNLTEEIGWKQSR